MLTPLMRQYFEIKSAHPDKIVLFRMGDFYEMFHEDAVRAAPLLGIALTQRNRKAGDETPLCGVPHHSVAGPIEKLLKAGLKVAICEQIEDPALAKGLVKRAVTRVLTPAVVYDPATLPGAQTNYIASFDQQAVAFFDASTFEAFYFERSTQDEAELKGLLERLQPAEVLCPHEPSLSGEWLKAFHLTPSLGQKLSQNISQSISQNISQNVISEPWLKWRDQHQELPQCALSLIEYAVSLQGDELLTSLAGFEKRQTSSHLHLSETVLRHLEIFANSVGDKKQSLFATLDCTKTSPGARRLKRWLQFPLVDEAQILSRQDQIAAWLQRPLELKKLRSSLAQVGDLERALAKIAGPNASARDLLALASTVSAAVALARELSLGAAVFAQLGEKQWESCMELAYAISSQLLEDPPLSVRQGNMFRRGVSPELDQLISLSEDAQGALLELQQKERELTGISSLKVKYNNVFGYFIEITSLHRQRVPERYQRKQTLANAERFITTELSELEVQIASSAQKRAELEAELFAQLRQQVLTHSAVILSLAHFLSELDAISSLAWLALERNYSRPVFVSTPQIELIDARHPVVEAQLAAPFVPNSVRLASGECLLLTGPNMAGKSTLMRQVALTVIMAQMGSYVPARWARLGIFDHIFSRIGASDNLSRGMSTFMVEMSETAEMLKQATPRSLLLLDEIGRGTSTYDGLSLAQAILEYILESKRTCALFATHYFELTRLSQRHQRLHNAHMAIRESGGEITFLYTLVGGPAQRSYGIQVAKLAGLPPQILARAEQILHRLESPSGAAKTPDPATPPSPSHTEHSQMNLLD